MKKEGRLWRLYTEHSVAVRVEGTVLVFAGCEVAAVHASW